MNVGEFVTALSFFTKFDTSRDALYYAANCYQTLGDAENATACFRKYQSMGK